MDAAERLSIVVGTAGHIDHGKTSLVKALTGVNTDRLEEEQRRGITIELGFAPLDIGSVHVGFVDVPGHEKFIKNMLAGAGGIDAMLLIVAADESVMPQTREHVEICRLLGITRALVAITKTDLVDAETVELVSLEATELLEENGYHDAPLLPVSAVSGEGIEALKAALAELATGVEQRNERALPRLPIDRVFTIRGFGTVVTGTLIAGSLKLGEAVEILPSRTRSTIKGLQVHNAAVQRAVAGHRVAVNIANVPTEAIVRGDFLTLANAMTPSAVLDLQVRILPDSPCSLEENQRVRFHSGAAELLGRVAILDGREIGPGGEGYARIRLEGPTAALCGDHFVIRRYSPMVTIGGGIVLDPLPEQRKQDKALLLSRLHAIAGADAAQRIAQYLSTVRGAAGTPQLTARFGLLKPEAEAAMRSALEAGLAVRVAETQLQVCGRGFFDEIRAGILAAVNRVHAATPLAEGMSLETMKKGMPRAVTDLLFRAALDALLGEGAVRLNGAVISAGTHAVSLRADQQTVLENMEAAFIAAGTAPPAPAEIIAAQNHADARALFDLLLTRGALVRIARDFFCHRRVIDAFIEQIRSHAQDGSFSVPDFKEWFGISRKYAIPLLEYLDAQGITFRDGDARRLAKR